MTDQLQEVLGSADPSNSMSTIDNHDATNALLLLSEQATKLKLEDTTTHEQRNVGVILQSLCHLHRWTRTNNDLHIYERSDRLRSVRLGIAAAHGRIRAAYPHRVSVKGKERAQENQPQDSLESLLENLTIKPNGTGAQDSGTLHEGYPFSVSTTQRRLSLFSPAVALAHGPDYVARLTSYLTGVAKAHSASESEVPDDLSQGDLYLCEQSLSALEGALGACIQAVDEVCSPAGSTQRAQRFVSVRPPGHHCESETPMGFCWLNNVAVAAAHAYLEHGVDRVVIFDIDLHHGNGTQQIVWRLNELAHKALQEQAKRLTSPRKGSPKKAPAVAEAPHPSKPPLQLYYGSLHDVNSYPCEDMDPTLIAAASVNISGGGGGQHIANVHLEPYASFEEFHHELYPAYRDALFTSAKRFVQKTAAQAGKTLVFISAGFDACEHEYPMMSRHGAKVPMSFYTRFAQDVSAFANDHSEGKLLAVLEGGYSLRALSTGVGQFLSGLVDDANHEERKAWWDTPSLEAMERLLPSTHTTAFQTKPRAVPKKVSCMPQEEWLRYTSQIFESMEAAMPDRDPPAKPPNPLKNPASRLIHETLQGEGRQTRSRGVTPQTSPAKKEGIPSETMPAQTALSQSGEAQVAALAAKVEEQDNKAVIREQKPDQQPGPAQQANRPAIRFTFKAGEASKSQKPNGEVKREET